MKNSFYEVTKSFDLTIAQDTTINLIDLNTCDEALIINFQLAKNVQLFVNFTVLNFVDFNKTITLNVNFDHANAHCEVNLNCLGLDQSVTALAVNGISKMSLTGYINIKINGIIDSDDAKIIGRPNFIFQTNKIDAHHSLAIGGVNPTELDYLTSRQISYTEAKYLLITAKLFKCLEHLDETQLKHYQQQILNHWEHQHVKY